MQTQTRQKRKYTRRKPLGTNIAASVTLTGRLGGLVQESVSQHVDTYIHRQRCRLVEDSVGILSLDCTDRTSVLAAVKQIVSVCHDIVGICEDHSRLEQELSLPAATRASQTPPGGTPQRWLKLHQRPLINAPLGLPAISEETGPANDPQAPTFREGDIVQSVLFQNLSPSGTAKVADVQPDCIIVSVQTGRPGRPVTTTINKDSFVHLRIVEAIN